MDLKDYNYFMTLETTYPQLSENTVTRLLEWHDIQKKMYVNKHINLLGNPWLYSIIKEFTEDALDDSKKIFVNENKRGYWNKDFLDEFSDLKEYFDNLPYTRISKIVLLELIRDCPPHKDLSNSLSGDPEIEPGSVRITLRKSKGDSFYVRPVMSDNFNTKSYDFNTLNYEFKHKKYYWDLEPGKVWLLNNLVCVHGADYIEGDNKVLISVQGRPDNEKLLKLIKSSYNLQKLVYPKDQHE